MEVIGMIISRSPLLQRENTDRMDSSKNCHRDDGLCASPMARQGQYPPPADATTVQHGYFVALVLHGPMSAARHTLPLRRVVADGRLRPGCCPGFISS